jgi:hypothetical protein
MRPFLIACVLTLFASPLSAAEDFRVMKLEQDVRTLEREVQTLQRLVNDLQLRARRTEPTFELDTDRAPQSNDSEQAWLKASAWNRLRTGMSELEVIEILGRPTALRPDANNRRALLYTLEIGTTGFLTGSVAFDNGKVVEIQKPTVR